MHIAYTNVFVICHQPVTDVNVYLTAAEQMKVLGVVMHWPATTRDLRIFETIPIRFDLKGTGWVKIFESAAPADVRQTTLTVQQKKLQQAFRCCN